MVLCRKLIHDELVARAKDKLEREMKKRRKLREEFESSLRRCRSIKEDTSWDDARKLLEKELDLREPVSIREGGSAAVMVHSEYCL